LKDSLIVDTTSKEVSNTEPVVTREYNIKGTRYLVTATVKDGASQDAATIVRRLIRKDVLGTS